MGKAGCRLIGWVMVFVVGAGGCQWTGGIGSRLGSWWRSAEDEEYRLLLKSIDEYARKNGLTRQQAIRQLREEADRYALQQRQQAAFYSQHGANLAPLAAAPHQAPPSGNGVNQASWAQPSPPGENPNPLGLKPSSSLFR